MFGHNKHTSLRYQVPTSTELAASTTATRRTTSSCPGGEVRVLWKPSTLATPIGTNKQESAVGRGYVDPQPFASRNVGVGSASDHAFIRVSDSAHPHAPVCKQRLGSILFLSVLLCSNPLSSFVRSPTTIFKQRLCSTVLCLVPIFYALLSGFVRSSTCRL